MSGNVFLWHLERLQRYTGAFGAAVPFMFVVGLGIGMLTTMSDMVQKNTASPHGGSEVFGLLEWEEKEQERRQHLAQARETAREVRKLRKEVALRQDTMKKQVLTSEICDEPKHSGDLTTDSVFLSSLI